MSYKLLVAALIAAVAIIPASVEAAKRPRREKSRAHRTSAKSSRHRDSAKKHGDKATSDRGEFERRWNDQQLEPDLPEAE
jgi:Flp pilus assembly protein TadB